MTSARQKECCVRQKCCVWCLACSNDPTCCVPANLGSLLLALRRAAKGELLLKRSTACTKLLLHNNTQARTVSAHASLGWSKRPHLCPQIRPSIPCVGHRRSRHAASRPSAEYGASGALCLPGTSFCQHETLLPWHHLRNGIHIWRLWLMDRFSEGWCLGFEAGSRQPTVFVLHVIEELSTPDRALLCRTVAATRAARQPPGCLLWGPRRYCSWRSLLVFCTNDQ